MQNNKIETTAMAIGIVFNFIMAFAGVYMYVTTNIDAIFLDGTFSLMEGISCIVAVIITKFSNRENAIFPDGLYVLEPLYSLLKCFVCFGLIGFASYEAVEKLYHYFWYGIGVPLQLDAVFIYAMIMVTLCLILSYIFHVYNKKTHLTSTILSAETKTAFVDGMLSLGIGITVVLLMFIPENSSLGFLYYIGDSAITLALVSVVIREPILILKSCFIELTHGVIQNKEILYSIEKVITEKKNHYDGFSVDDMKVYKTGKHIQVALRIHPTTEQVKTDEVQAFRHDILVDLHKEFALIAVDIVL